MEFLAGQGFVGCPYSIDGLIVESVSTEDVTILYADCDSPQGLHAMKGVRRLRLLLSAALICFLFPFLLSTSLHADSGPLFALESVEAQLVQASGDEERLELLLRRGGLLRKLGRYPEAMTDAGKALRLAEALDAPVKAGLALRLQGTVEAEQGRLGEAIRLFVEARDVLSTTDAQVAHARTVMAIGVAYVMAEIYEDSRDYLEEARALVQNLDGDEELDALRLALVTNLAIVIQNVEGMEASLPFYREALFLARALENDSEVARVLAIMCRPLVETGRLEMAEEACQEGLASLDELGSVRLQAGVRLNLAHLRLAQDDWQAAEVHLEEALALADGKVPTVERDAYRQLSELYEARGEYRRALATYRQARAMERAMLDEERRREIARLEVLYELEESERQIELLRLDQELAAERLQQRGWILWGTSSGLIIISFLAFLIWHVYRARARRGEELAARDALTGLLNRRGFRILAEMEEERGQREGYIKAVAMADIDHFKPINDKYGHAVGDAVLKAVSDRLQNNVRGFDSVIRWGGEEFLVLLPRVEEDELFELASRLLNAVTRDPIDTEAGEIPITMTIGIARVTDTIDEALAQADKALYEGKHAGRNQVMVAD
jgi:diguanylate cyclase (GGDEF)-like protein